MAWDMWLVINLHPHSLEEIQGICPNHKCSMKKFWKFLFLKVFYHRVRVCLISKPLNQVYGDFFLNVSVPAKFCNEKWLKLVRLIACNSTFKIMDCLSFQNQLTKITYKKLIYSWNFKKKIISLHLLNLSLNTESGEGIYQSFFKNCILTC